MLRSRDGDLQSLIQESFHRLDDIVCAELLVLLRFHDVGVLQHLDRADEEERTEGGWRESPATFTSALPSLSRQNLATCASGSSRAEQQAAKIAADADHTEHRPSLATEILFRNAPSVTSSATCSIPRTPTLRAPPTRPTSSPSLHRFLSFILCFHLDLVLLRAFVIHFRRFSLPAFSVVTTDCPKPSTNSTGISCIGGNI
jgi:hypothetical protein